MPYFCYLSLWVAFYSFLFTNGYLSINYLWLEIKIRLLMTKVLKCALTSLFNRYMQQPLYYFIGTKKAEISDESLICILSEFFMFALINRTMVNSVTDLWCICLTYCQFLILNNLATAATICYKSQPSNVPHWAQTSQAFLAMQCFEPWSKMEQRCVKNSLLLFCLILLQTQKHWAVWQNCNSESWFYLKGSLFVPTDGLIDIANCTNCYNSQHSISNFI